MPDRPLTVGDVQQHAMTLSAMSAALQKLLTGLAAGKYDKEVEFTEDLLLTIGVVFPPFVQLEKAGEVLLAINRMTAPRGPIVPDGHGGFVPASNSRYDPKTGRFI